MAVLLKKVLLKKNVRFIISFTPKIGGRFSKYIIPKIVAKLVKYI